MKRTAIILLLTAFAQTAFSQTGDSPFRFDTIYTERSPSVEPEVRQLPQWNIDNTTSTQSRPATSQNRRERQASDNTSRQAARPKGQWSFGGNFGMSFGDYTNINISPQVGYRWNRYFMAGGGINYNYYERNDYDLNYFGMHLFGRVYPVNYIMLFAQPEVQRRWGRVWGAKTESKVFGAFLLGGGVVIPVAPRSAFQAAVYYDVLQNDYSPYGDNIGYSVGYIFSF